MSQNEQPNPAMMGFVFVAAAFFLLLIFALFLLQIAAIAYAGFFLFVVNKRYKVIGVGAGAATMFLLTQPAGDLILSAHKEFDVGVLLWSYNLMPFSLMAFGFIIAILVMDFLNNQRNLPTSDDDWRAWRIKHGFTKGMDLSNTTPLPRHHIAQSDVFDVPPQDRG